MSNDENELGRIDLQERGVVIISAHPKSSSAIDIRLFTRGNGKEFPTKKGIRISPNEALKLSKLIQQHAQVLQLMND